MYTIHGWSPNGSDRILECESVYFGKKISLWLHSPGGDNGWAIEVEPQELVKALQKLSVNLNQ